MREQRRLAAILAADVVGYSRLMGVDEAGTHARLRALRKDLIEPLVAEHEGRIVKLTGDGALVEFASVVGAVECAVQIQRRVAEHQAAVPDRQRIVFRIGINLGDVIVDEGDIYGDGVNVAARLEQLADAGAICVSRTVRNQVRDKLDFGFEDLGEHHVKNIARPIRVFRVVPAGAVPRGPARAWRLMTWAVPAAGIVVLVVAVGGWWWHQGREPARDPGSSAQRLLDKPSIAVLPFDNLNADVEEEYFANGLTDDLITDLSRISGLFVIARNSVFTYKDQPVDIREVAEKLGVRYVLEGSVRRAGGRIRINVQLIEGSSGRHVWADRYDRDYAEIFTLQDEVIARIVEALEVELSETERTQVARLPTDDLEAYDYYLRAEELIYRSDSASVAAALDLYEKAIALDSNFAEAYAGYARVAADVLAYNYANTLPAAVARKRAYEAAGRALLLNPQLSRGYSVLALLQMVDGEHEHAIASARKAVGLGPNSAEAYLNLAVVLTYAGIHDEALQAMETVLRLNPMAPSYVHDYHGLVLYMNHRYAETVATLDTMDDAAMSDLALQTLAAAYARLGRLDQAKAATGALLKRYPGDSVEVYRVTYAHHARKEDLTDRLEPLRLAGLPEWPYGFEGDPQDQVRGDTIDALTFGRTWIGELAMESAGPFMRYTDRDGSFVERGPNSQSVGTASRDGDLLCLQTPGLFMGRRYCGLLYRNPTGTPEGQDEYSFVSAAGIRRFTTEP